jgi:Leucine-rich repeat (LRR) protein
MSVTEGNEVFQKAKQKILESVGTDTLDLSNLELTNKILTELLDNQDCWNWIKENNFTKINLSFNRLNGTETLNRLAQLPGLKSFDIILNRLGQIPSLNSLDLSHNKIKKISDYAFYNLANLKSLNLTNSKIGKFDEGAFNNLTALESLDISRNYIAEIPEILFRNLINLKYLNLNTNTIEIIERNTFNNLTALESLDIGKNCITEIPEMLFSDLINLKYLNLNDNQIESINDDIFDIIRQNTSLYLYLYDNSLEATTCDKILDFIAQNPDVADRIHLPKSILTYKQLIYEQILSILDVTTVENRRKIYTLLNQNHIIVQFIKRAQEKITQEKRDGIRYLIFEKLLKEDTKDVALETIRLAIQNCNTPINQFLEQMYIEFCTKNSIKIPKDYIIRCALSYWIGKKAKELEITGFEAIEIAEGLLNMCSYDHRENINLSNTISNIVKEEINKIPLLYQHPGNTENTYGLETLTSEQITKFITYFCITDKGGNLIIENNRYVPDKDKLNFITKCYEEEHLSGSTFEQQAIENTMRKIFTLYDKYDLIVPMINFKEELYRKLSCAESKENALEMADKYYCKIEKGCKKIQDTAIKLNRVHKKYTKEESGNFMTKLSNITNHTSSYKNITQICENYYLELYKKYKYSELENNLKIATEGKEDVKKRFDEEIESTKKELLELLNAVKSKKDIKTVFNDYNGQFAKKLEVIAKQTESLLSLDYSQEQCGTQKR